MENYTPVWVESMNGMGNEAVYCPFVLDFCEHFRECKGECDCYKQPVVYVCEHIENGVCMIGRTEYQSGSCHKCPRFSPVPIPHILEAREEQTVMSNKVVLVEPQKTARIAEMDFSLESMQKTVGGLIQAIYPYDDPVALVCNDEGKLLNLPLNRALKDVDGQTYDIVAGTFFICGLSEANFTGLSDELAALYLEKFRNPEMFLRKPDGGFAILEVINGTDEVK